MRQKLDTDILIAGGGLAGLAAALRLAAAGHRALCVETGPRPERKTASRDRRTTAILMPGIETLDRAGVWPSLEGDAQPLAGMRIVDCGGRERRPRGGAEFDAAETRRGLFGWNVENGKVRASMANAIDAHPQAEAVYDTALTHWASRRDGVLATLSDGTQVAARLLIGADGRGSAVRRSEGIGLRRWGYDQKIIACHVEHSGAHGGVSTEMHHVGGPLTFAPLPGNRSGLVWMNAESEADRLAELDDAAFLAELNERSAGVIGEVTAATPRQVWPATTQVATGLTAQRVALIAEAAHAFPPIGAQGFNLSLRDIETLAETCEGAEDPGDAELLNRYARKRMPDILSRVAGVDLLNRSVRSEAQPIRDLRRLGLSVIGGLPPLRRLAMRIGMGS